MIKIVRITGIVTVLSCLVLLYNDNGVKATTRKRPKWSIGTQNHLLRCNNAIVGGKQILFFCRKVPYHF